VSLKDNSCHYGKNSQRRIIVLFILLAFKTSGAHKLLFLITGYSTNPHSFKNITKFPTRHIENRKVWVTEAILLTI
jgi:hypothetical protein